MASGPVCIIPARGGSKRIPRKNVARFNGQPMIAWPIRTALESGVFERVICSTDDPEIAEIAQQWGADVPFMRDAGLADDFATTADVLEDALSRLSGHEIACCLYPTAPLVLADDLRRAHAKLLERNADCVLSVCDYDFHPLRAFIEDSNGNLEFKWPEYELTRSQDLPEVSHDAGMFYFLRTKSFMKTKKIINGQTLGLKIPRDRAVDIDTPEDFEIARILHARLAQDMPDAT